VAVDATRRRVLVACTRNPNMVLELAAASDGTLLPRRCWYYPGRLYLHDLAFVGGALHGNAVGLDVVVRLPESGGFEPAWWPRCVDAGAEPRLGPNTLQLNSIAAGPDLAGSFFSASAAAPGRWRPGHARFPVDGRGVVFAGDTREPIAGGLTRPHSARLHRGRIYVDNSGYGELGRLRDGSYEPVARLPGWTRGLCLHDRVAFVGTSRVIPRFRQYAPGLRVSDSVAGVHAVEVATGRILGSILWPEGNQVFAVEMAPAGVGGLPARRRGQDLQPLFFHGAAR
jgi:uncharacterized protein (TIGR03032 family)